MFTDLALIEDINQSPIKPRARSPQQSGAKQQNKAVLTLQVDNDKYMNMRRIDRNDLDLIFKKVASQKRCGNFL